MDDTYRHHEQFTVRSSEVYPSGSLRPGTIFDYLQEAAGTNAAQLNFNIDDLKTDHLTWVLHRMHLRMDRYPRWRDSITVTTWPSGGNGFRAYRDFLITDEEGTEIGRALSHWLMVNVQTKRPMPIPDAIKGLSSHDEEHVVPLQKTRIKEPAQVSFSHEFAVRAADIDLNDHVNNAVYVAWMVESSSTQQPAEIDVEFKAESKYGDRIQAGMQKNQKEIVLKRKRDGTIIAIAHIK